MKILLDENVCLNVAASLREDGHEVLAIAESSTRGMRDSEIWPLACNNQFLIITRDYHFTNAVRFDPARCLGIVYLRRGNLKAIEETALVRRFIASHPLGEYRGRLVTLSPQNTWIR